jgi:hypothetical protein
MDWRYGSRGRVSALQAQSPLQSQSKKANNNNFIILIMSVFVIHIETGRKLTFREVE